MANAILLALVVLRGAAYWAVGEYTHDVLILAGIALPLMLMGIFIGNRIHTGLSELVFRRLVGAALIASGAALGEERLTGKRRSVRPLRGSRDR